MTKRNNAWLRVALQFAKALDVIGEINLSFAFADRERQYTSRVIFFLPCLFIRFVVGEVFVFINGICRNVEVEFEACSSGVLTD
jgi:hypothetical protein